MTAPRRSWWGRCSWGSRPGRDASSYAVHPDSPRRRGSARRRHAGGMMAGVTGDEVVRFRGVPDRIDLPAGRHLRRWSVDDVDAQVAAVNASLEHLRPWMPWAGEAATSESAGTFVRESIQQFEEGTAFNFAIRADDGEIVGGAGLMARQGPGVLEIGYWVAAGHTGRGIATD